MIFAACGAASRDGEISAGGRFKPRADAQLRLPGLSLMASRGPCLMGDETTFDGCGLDGLLQLLEGSHLDLSDPLARDAVLLGQILERRRVVTQTALGQDMALAVVQMGHRLFEQVASQA